MKREKYTKKKQTSKQTDKQIPNIYSVLSNRIIFYIGIYFIYWIYFIHNIN